MDKNHYILGIETSCDETAASIVKNGTEIISSIVSSQIQQQKQFGGVVPEIASRLHVEQITLVIQEALNEAKLVPSDLEAVTVTEGPGLVGALLIGINAAKAFAFANQLPLIGVHHIAGHVYANQLIHEMEFPLLALIVSGGHTELVVMKSHGSFELIGETRDDAAGEAYDKVARVLGLPYPGGPQVDQLALASDESIDFPRAWLEKDSYDFSFSGLKSSVINYKHNIEQKGGKINHNHVAAGFQQSVIDVLTVKTVKAAKEYDVKQVIAAGGVAANQGLRKSLTTALEKEGIPFYVPPISLCTDNAAMIAAAGYEMWKSGVRSDLSMNGRPGMPLKSWNY